MKKCIRLTGLLLAFIFLTAPVVHAAGALIPGGQIIGLSLEDSTLTVAKLDETLPSGKNAGLKPGDRITHIDGTPVVSAAELRQALCRSHGTVDIRLLRGKQALDLTASPDITPDGPRLGIYLKEGITGIGTVTWYDPASGSFGALGHSVNAPGGELLDMTRGTAYEASILSVKKGKSGTPGQLMGQLDPNTPVGSLEKNSSQGIFGKLNRPIPGEAMEIGSKDQVKTGKATIRSTVSGDGVQEYSVKIQKIYPEKRTDGRNMLIKVTDPALLEATGGIVQGMSGSPICQDGRIVGAVTHVLVNDPTMGYGIFIENMLEAAG